MVWIYARLMLKINRVYIGVKLGFYYSCSICCVCLCLYVLSSWWVPSSAKSGVFCLYGVDGCRGLCVLLYAIVRCPLFRTPGCCLASGMRALFASFGAFAGFYCGCVWCGWAAAALAGGVLWGGVYGFAAGVFCEGAAGLFRFFLGGCDVCFWGLVPALFPGAAFAFFLRWRKRALPVRVIVSEGAGLRLRRAGFCGRGWLSG